MKRLLLFLFTVALVGLLGTNALAQWGGTVSVSNDNEYLKAMQDPTVQNVVLAEGYYTNIERKIEDGEVMVKNQPKGGGNSRSPLDCVYGAVGLPNQCWVASPSISVTLTASATGTGCSGPVLTGWVCADAQINGFPIALPTITGTGTVATATGFIEGGEYLFSFEWLSGDYSFSPIKIWGLPTANLGPDQTVCKNNLPLQLSVSASPFYHDLLSPRKNGVLSYAWSITGSGGSLSSSTVANPTFNTTATSGTYTVCVTVTEFVASYVLGGFVIPSHTCSVSDCYTITVTPMPTANAGGDKTIGSCFGQTTTLNGSGTGTGITYSWSPGTYLSNSGIATPTFTGAPTGIYTYTLTVTGANTCIATDEVVVTVTGGATADAGADKTIGACQGQSTILNGSGTGTGSLSYLWSPATYLSNAAIAAPTFANAPAGTYNYCLKVTDANGCTANDCLVVTVMAAPTVNAGPDKTIGACTGQNTSLEGSGTGTGITYLWSPATYLSNASIATPVFSGAPAGNYCYTLTVKDIYNCTTADVACVTVVALPSANAGVDKTIGACAGQSTTLNGSGTGTGITYLWSPATYLSNASIATPTFSGAPAGTYTYCLTVKDIYNCSTNDCMVVTVTGGANAEAGPNKTIGACQGQSTVLNGSGTGTGSLSYLWTPATYLSNAAIAAPTFSNAPTGTYIYCLKVTDANGCTANDCVSVTVDAAPTVTAGADKTIGACSGQSTILDGSGTGTGITYLWSPATYLNNASIATPTFSGAPAGNYCYTLTVKDIYNCTTADVACVTVLAGPTANAGADKTVGACAGQSTTLNGSGTGTGITYLWSPATYLSNASIATPTFSGAPAGTYTYCLTVKDIYNCSTNDCMVVTVTGGATADAGADKTIGACYGQSTVLNGSGTGTGVLSYLWTPATYLSNAAIATPIFSGINIPSGTYNYCLKVTDANGCTANDCLVVTVAAAPTVNAGPDKTIGACSGQSTVLNGSGTGTGITYLWSPATYLNNPSIATPTFSGAPAGNYCYTLTVKDIYNCTTADIACVTVVAIPTANAGPDKTIGACAGQSTVLNGSGTGAPPLSYLWTPGNYLSNAAIATPTFSGAGVGTYSYILKVTDFYGCTATDNVVVIVDPLPTVNAGPDQTICADVECIQMVGYSFTGAACGIWSGGLGSWTNDVYCPTTAERTAGSVELTYTTCQTYHGCDPIWDKKMLYIKPLPTVTCGGPFTVCELADTFNLADLVGFSPPGGKFYNFDGILVTEFDPGTEGTFTHTFTYVYTDPVTHCSNHCTFTIYVDEMGEASLEGQVKYWNNVETYMPTPFPTDIYGTTPPDYFYVALYESTVTVDPQDPLANAVDWEKVDIVQTEVWDPLANAGLGAWVIDKDFMSYFKFETLLDPETIYYITVWDGSNLWQEWENIGSQTGNQYNPELGSSYTWHNWGGVSGIDALAMQYMINGATNMHTFGWNWIGDQNYTGLVDYHYGFYSHSIANVNSSANGITALDALTTQYRIAGLQPTFPNMTPNFRVSGRFVDELPKITWYEPFTNHNYPIDLEFYKSSANYTYFTPAINNYYQSQYFSTSPFFLVQPITSVVPLGVCPDYGYINLYYEATGDVNASYVPTSENFKAEPSMKLQYENEIAVQKGEIIAIPVSVDRNAELGSIALGLTFRNDLIKILEVPGYEVVNIDNEKGFVRVVWTDVNGRSVNADEAIVTIKALVLNDITADTRLFELEAMTELGNLNAQAIEDINLKTVAIGTKPAGSSELFVANYPNPFNSKTTISYNLPEAGTVKLVVFNKLGAEITTLVNQYQTIGTHTIDLDRGDFASGVYYYRLVLQGTKDTYSATKSMVITE